MKKKGENKSQILKITFRYSACGSLHCQHLLVERDSTFRSQISDFMSAAHGQPDTSTQWAAFTHSCFGLNPHHQTVKKLNCSGERLLIFLPFFLFIVLCSLSQMSACSDDSCLLLHPDHPLHIPSIILFHIIFLSCFSLQNLSHIPSELLLPWSLPALGQHLVLFAICSCAAAGMSSILDLRHCVPPLSHSSFHSFSWPSKR